MLVPEYTAETGILFSKPAGWDWGLGVRDWGIRHLALRIGGGMASGLQGGKPLSGIGVVRIGGQDLAEVRDGFIGSP